MADIPGAGVKMTIEENSVDSPQTAALYTKFGANVNYLLDQDVVRAGQITTLQSPPTIVTSSVPTQNTQITTFVTATGANINITARRGPILVFMYGVVLAAGDPIVDYSTIPQTEIRVLRDSSVELGKVLLQGVPTLSRYLAEQFIPNILVVENVGAGVSVNYQFQHRLLPGAPALARSMIQTQGQGFFGAIAF